MLDHLDDLESDFSVFHRVDDIYAMDSRRFFRLAERIFAYQGVCALKAQADEAAQPQPAIAPREGEQLIGSDPASLRASPLGPYISIAQV